MGRQGIGAGGGDPARGVGRITGLGPRRRRAALRGGAWRSALLPGAAVLLLLGGPEAGAAQLGSTASLRPGAPPKVFLDCQSRRNCDFDHFRTELQFVTWVRDRADSDVHVIFTTTEAGGGGQRYTLDFVGRGDLAGLHDELTYTSHGSDVQAEVLEGLTHTLGLGLLRYAVQSGKGGDFTLGYHGNAGADGGGEAGGNGQEALYDPWNYWTFRVGLSGNMSIQERRSSRRINPTLSANRVTGDWKVNLNLFSNLSREWIQLSDDREVRNDIDHFRVTALVVRSVGDHVSVGVDTGARNSVRNNQRVRVDLAPALEWNYFPYMQATRRQFIAHYAVGFEYSNYEEETLFGVTEETVPLHRVAVEYRAREEWGNAGMGVDAFQYLHGGGLYSFGLRGDLAFRVARGLELNVSGDAARVADQIHLPAGDASDEDILLGRQALPTGFDYQASLGLSYRWGSSFANVVNSRFPRSVR